MHSTWLAYTHPLVWISVVLVAWLMSKIKWYSLEKVVAYPCTLQGVASKRINYAGRDYFLINSKNLGNGLSKRFYFINKDKNYLYLTVRSRQGNKLFYLSYYESEDGKQVNFQTVDSSACGGN